MHFKCFVIVTGFSLCLMWPSQIKAQNCATLLDSGDIHFKDFDNAAALRYYERAYELCPDSYEALWKTTRALVDHGEDLGGRRGKQHFERGLELSAAMVARYPGAVQSHFLRAAAAGNLARLSGARTKVRLSRVVVASARKAIATDSSYSPSYVILGAYYREVATAGRLLRALAQAFFGGLPKGTLKQSEDALSRAIALDRKNLYAHLERARTYWAMGHKRKAIEEAKTVLELPITDHYSVELKKQARAFLESNR